MQSIIPAALKAEAKRSQGLGISEMTQWVKGIAAKPKGLSSILGTKYWKERLDSCKLSSDLYTLDGGAYVCSHINTYYKSVRTCTCKAYLAL